MGVFLYTFAHVNTGHFKVKNTKIKDHTVQMDSVSILS